MGAAVNENWLNNYCGLNKTQGPLQEEVGVGVRLASPITSFYLERFCCIVCVDPNPQLTLGVNPGTSRSASLHRTTPSFSDVFKNSSGSAMFFLGELSTPSDINHVTVCSSGFIAPRNDHCPSTRLSKKTGGLFRINMQLTSVLLLQVRKEREGGGGGRTTRFLHAKLMITPTGKQAPQQCAGVIF